MKRLFPISIVLVLSLLCISCSPTDGFDGGHAISKEDLESMSAALFDGENVPTESAPAYSHREPNTYYWTENGHVYHKYRDCIYLKNADRVKSGSLIVAQANGKESPCSSCCGVD